MIGRWEARFYRFRKSLSRSEWMVRILGAPKHQDGGTEPGLVLIQIDGLARAQLEQALRHGRLPFLRRLIRRERYRLHTMYSGQPATTPAVQGELFYGVKTAVAAFGFRDRETGKAVKMLSPEIAAEKELEIAARGHRPLFNGGSAYTDIFGGGAAEPHFCAASLTWRQVLARIRPRLWPAVLILYFPTLVRVVCRVGLELLVALYDAVGGILRLKDPASELAFIGPRILVGVILREWAVVGAMIDATRGLPVVHLNFLGYDEQAHRRGPDSYFAHWSLKGIDRAIRRVWKVASDSPRREYDVWIYSDHGQERTIPYPLKFGRTIEEAVTAVFDHLATDKQSSADQPNVQVVAEGPVGYLYPDCPFAESDCERIAERLVNEAAVPMVLFPSESSGVRFWTTSGRKGVLPEDAAELLGPEHPFLRAVAADLVAMCRHPEAGAMTICGWNRDEPPFSFLIENGAHAGPGQQETSAFVLLPNDAPIRWDSPYLRPLDLRASVLRWLDRKPRKKKRAGPSAKSVPADSIRFVTYNVHGCHGMDGKISSRRIARVLAQCEADVIALQELDVGRTRSEREDQAEAIAHELNMTLHFSPAMWLEEGVYGSAILSRFPMKLVQEGPLPKHSLGLHAEPRGAMCVELDVGGQKVRVFNTHLGLNGLERLGQVEALLGAEWLGRFDRNEPTVFCGDLNASPRSKSYRLLAEQMHDARLEPAGTPPQATFFSRLPLLRLDHIFFQGAFDMVGAEVVRTSLAKKASDHLPLVAELRIASPQLHHGRSLSHALYRMNMGGGSPRGSAE